MENTNNILPRLAIKRRLENIIADEWKHELVDYFKTSVDSTPQVWITQIDEQFSPLNPTVQNKRLEATTSITVVVFSNTEETQVHEIIRQLMDLTPQDFPELKIQMVTPQASSTSYQSESSDGHVMAAITLDLKYFYTRK